MELIFYGQVVIPGQAHAQVLVSSQPLSFWGGYDWQTGEIIDRRHPLSGSIAKGKILAIPFARGSSTTTAVLLEAIRARTAPAAILTTSVDFFFALASVVAEALYTSPMPLMALSKLDFGRIRTNDNMQISIDGRVVVNR